MKNLLLSSALAFALIGCGGSSNNTPESTKTDYKGAITKGDYVTFTFDSSTLNLTYSVDSNSRYFGGVSGSVTLSNPYGKFYISSSLGASAMIANNLLIGKIPQNNDTAYVVGLQSSSAPTVSQVAGSTHKKYVYTHIDKNSNVTLHTLQVNSNGTFTETNLGSSVTSTGCWKIDSGRLVAKGGVNNCTNVTSFDFNIVIKPGSSRSGIVVDYANGDGIGIGLEQQQLSTSDVAGTYESYYFENNDDNFAKVEIDSSGTLKWKACPGGSCTMPYSNGTLSLNQDCDGNTVDGIACATVGGNNYLAFIDNEDNYYIAVSASGTPFHVEVGAK